MKKFIYIFSVLLLALTACQEELIDRSGTGGEKDGFVTLNFAATMPEYKLATKSEVFSSLYLMTFDADGKFLGRYAATYTQPDANDEGTGSARVPITTRTIHFVANYNWDGYDEESLLGLNEKVVMPALTSSVRVFWGRIDTPNLYATNIHVDLLRNYAKITVEDDTFDGDGLLREFKLDGFALGHYPSQGTITTFGESGASSFAKADDVLTLPSSMSYINDNNEVCNMDPKYTFETNNPESAPTYVIIRNEAGRYYKLHLLQSSETLIPWKIERNYHYRIVLRSFEKDPFTNGVGTFDEAMNAAPANNLYAEIIKESPVISDADKNRLELEKLVYLYTSGTSFSIQANYYPGGSTTANNTDMDFRIVDDEHGILSGLTINDGELRGHVATVADGQKDANVRISKNGLSRIVHIISTQAYSFDATSPVFYGGKDAPVSIDFNIPDDYPTALLPVLCKIHATKLYPVDPNKNMLVKQENGTYYYIYEAYSTGPQSVQFKTSLSDSEGTVTIENEYFTTASIEVSKLPSFGNGSLSGSYTVLGGTATLQFTTPARDYDYAVSISLPANITGPTSYTVPAGQTSHIVTGFTTAGATNTTAAVNQGSVTLSAEGLSATTINGVFTGQNLIRYTHFYYDSDHISTTDITTSNSSDRFRNIGTDNVAKITAVSDGSDADRYYTISIDPDTRLNSTARFRYKAFVLGGNYELSPTVATLVGLSETPNPANSVRITLK